MRERLLPAKSNRDKFYPLHQKQTKKKGKICESILFKTLNIGQPRTMIHNKPYRVPDYCIKSISRPQNREGNPGGNKCLC